MSTMNKTTMMKVKKADSKRSNNSMVNSTVSATSPMAMGKALVILATSCAALSSQPMAATTRGVSASQPRSSMRGGRTGRSSSHRNNRFHSSVVALHYRDGDADQSAAMQSVNQQAIDKATVEAASNSNLATPTLDASSRSRSNFTFKSLPTIVNPPTLQLLVSLMPHTLLAPAPAKVEDEQQLLMDEYVEFYERRYTRLHPRHRTQQSSPKRRPRGVLDFQLPRKIFLSAVAFHRPSSNGHSITNQQPQQPAAKPVINTRQAEEEEEDPLNVLGLSNLASAKLRQRLHVPRDLRDEHMLLTSGTTSAVKFYHYMTHTGHVSQLSSISEKTLASISGKAVASTAPVKEGGRTSSYISLSFPAQVTLLVKTLQRMTLAFANTMKILTAFASRMFSEILEKGGFRHSVRMMSVASLAVLLMFRPLFKGALKQG